MENHAFQFLDGIDRFQFPCKDYFSPENLTAEAEEKEFTWRDVWNALDEDNTSMVLMTCDPLLLSHPNKQEGRDFAMVLAGLAALDYSVQWRVIELSAKGPVLCLFAYKTNSAYGRYIQSIPAATVLKEEGFLAKLFATPHDKLEHTKEKELEYLKLPTLFSTFCFHFENVGLMSQGKIVTSKFTGDASHPIHATMKQLVEKFMD